MTVGPLNGVIQRLRQIAGSGAAEATDGQLVGRFLECRDQPAFEALVARHGPMVLGVCRRVLGSGSDADDAFQATFLVFVRKARSIVRRERVGGWLYRIAYRTARKARAAAHRRRTQETPIQDMAHPAADNDVLWRDLRPVLDQELDRLPERYRLPVVLCDLEGRSRDEVARQLAWPDGTLSSRLARARQLLAKRLARRGVLFSGGALAATLAGNGATAAVPAPLLRGGSESPYAACFSR
jgi:RNA polymerase sigma factor (sigma-70 family)